MTLGEVKDDLQVTTDSQDARIQRLLDEAEDWIKRITGTQFTETNIKANVEGGGFALRPLILPIIKINSITDNIDAALVDTDLFRIVANNEVVFQTGSIARWGRGRDRFLIDYEGGFGGVLPGSLSLPLGVKTAIKELTARRFTNNNGLKSQSGKGWSFTFSDFMESDIVHNLMPYIRRPLL